MEGNVMTKTRIFNAREVSILLMRKCATLREIGRIYGISSNRVRQIEAKALRKLALCRKLEEGDPITLTSQLERLHLSCNAYNCLRRANINTVGDIIKHQDELCKLKNLGEVTLEEIHAVMRICNHPLKEVKK